MTDNGESAYVREVDEATRAEHDLASRRVYAWLQRQKREPSRVERHAWEWKALERTLESDALLSAGGN